VAAPAPKPFVSRAGLKLAHALEAFALDVTGMDCADFGSNVGGFSDCLLKAGAASIIAIDTGHNVLAWSLRSDPRVDTRERTNALHEAPPAGGVDLVVIDMAWTRQRLAIPAALAWMPEDPDRRARARIVSLVKPHYELEPGEKEELLVEGRLDHATAATVARRTVEALDGVTLLGLEQSPVTGGKSSRKGTGNIEFLALLRPA
jgi:23S rRNA (cytidine1920-2'-O)/16S rRNA (cytidine1409-2'-O)-methyltransferase